ncbi:MAG: phosphohistidine phosphatase SixA, partial [Desulfobacterales bacterium]|nr:phosphohistidine phosphatase SixA [Desulfobacterales bacterium]
MAIYLVQHAECLAKDQDPEKGLSDLGTANATRIAEVAAGYNVPVARILHSGKKRARQTAEIFSSFLAPPEGLAAVEGIKPLDDVALFGDQLDSNTNTMVVGHLPFMEKLAAYLITGRPDKPVIKFQNAG